jgi:hypothetical protein
MAAEVCMQNGSTRQSGIWACEEAGCDLLQTGVRSLTIKDFGFYTNLDSAMHAF